MQVGIIQTTQTAQQKYVAELPVSTIVIHRSLQPMTARR